MRRIGLLLLVGLLVFCAACASSEIPTADADTPTYETVFPAFVNMEDPAAAAQGSAVLTGTFSHLQRYTITAPDLTQEQMEAVMEQTAQRGGCSFIDTEEQWENGRVIGTRALCSNGVVIRVWSDGTMQLIWPQTLSVSVARTGDVLADSEAFYRCYYEAYGDFLQFSDPVYQVDSTSESLTGDRYPMVILDGQPSEALPFPAQARFIPGDDERGDRLELTFHTGEVQPLGQQPLRVPELTEACRAVCLTYGRISGTDTYEPVYVFFLEEPEADTYRTVITPALTEQK